MKHEESFPHRTPSVQYFAVKVRLVFFQIFASAFTTENTLSELLTSSGISFNHQKWNSVTAAHKTQRNYFLSVCRVWAAFTATHYINARLLRKHSS